MLILTTIHSYLPAYFFHQSASTPFDKCSNLKDLAHLLTSDVCDLDQWLKWKPQIKAFIQKQGKDLQQLDIFLKTVTEWGIKQNPQKTIAVLVDIVSLDLLTQAVKFQTHNSEVPFRDIFEWAAEHQPFCPEQAHHSLKTRIYSEWKKCRPLVIYFIPNLINIFLRAFNFLDAHKKATTLFDLSLVLEIIYKFFIIPYCLIKILQPIFSVTAKVYVVSALIIVATGVLISVYLRWFRPLPDEIVNCTNLDKKMDRGEIEPKVGQAKELQRLVAALEVGSNVLLIGDSGEGKTALFEHFVQLKYQKKLSKHLQDLIAYEIDCGLMISNVSFGHAELVNQTMDQIKEGRKPERALLFFDEFHQLATNQAAFHAFKKRFLEDKPHSQFVAAITSKEFEEIKKLDKDGSFRRRVVPIVVQSLSDEQNHLILREKINRMAKDIPITNEAIEAILKISALEDYLPGIGRPAKAIKILMDGIGLCRSSYNPHYIPEKIEKARQEYQALQLQAQSEMKVDPKTLKKIREVKARIEFSKQELEKDQKRVLEIKKLLGEQEKIQNDYYRLTHLIAKGKPVNREMKIKYLWYYFYAYDALKKQLQQKIKQVGNQMVVQVDEKLIYQVYEDYKAVEKQIYGDKAVSKVKLT